LTPIAPVREIIGADNIEAAYATQEINTTHWRESGRVLVGRKIGLTSEAVQKQLGVDRPDYGMLFADMQRDSGSQVELNSLLQPKVEAEVAFVLGVNLHSETISNDDLLAAIDCVLAAIEIVDSRVQDWDITIADTIADNASSGLFVLGDAAAPLSSVDLESCEMTMKRHGQVVSTGIGSACLGSPLNTTKWLAQVMARSGRPLNAGDIVLSGALGPMVEVQAGDVFVADIEGLGQVEVVFT